MGPKGIWSLPKHRRRVRCFHDAKVKSTADDSYEPPSSAALERRNPCDVFADDLGYGCRGWRVARPSTLKSRNGFQYRPPTSLVRGQVLGGFDALGGAGIIAVVATNVGHTHQRHQVQAGV